MPRKTDIRRARIENDFSNLQQGVQGGSEPVQVGPGLALVGLLQQHVLLGGGGEVRDGAAQGQRAGLSEEHVQRA